jgi:hypothetical protein
MRNDHRKYPQQNCDYEESGAYQVGDRRSEINMLPRQGKGDVDDIWQTNQGEPDGK